MENVKIVLKQSAADDKILSDFEKNYMFCVKCFIDL